MALPIFLKICIVNQRNVLNQLRRQWEDTVLHCFETTGPLSTITELYPEMIFVFVKSGFWGDSPFPPALQLWSSRFQTRVQSVTTSLPHTQEKEMDWRTQKGALCALPRVNLFLQQNLLFPSGRHEGRDKRSLVDVCPGWCKNICSRRMSALLRPGAGPATPVLSLTPPHILLVRFPQTGRAREVRVEETKETPCCQGLRWAVSTTNSWLHLSSHRSIRG